MHLLPAYAYSKDILNDNVGGRAGIRGWGAEGVGRLREWNYSA